MGDSLGEPVHMSLEEFSQKAFNLSNGEGAEDEASAHKRFAMFVLTGQDPDHRTQAYIDLNEYRGNLIDEQLKLTQDFDSMLVRSRSLPYSEKLFLYVWPQRFQTDHKLRQRYNYLHTERVSGSFLYGLSNMENRC